MNLHSSTTYFLSTPTLYHSIASFCVYRGVPHFDGPSRTLRKHKEPTYNTMWSTENHATSGSHIRLPNGTLVANRYEIVSEAGSGNFARVFECRDIKTNGRVAVKFMKPGYERDADFEIDVLSAVAKKDPTDTCGLVRFIERVTCQGHVGLVFTLKGKALRSTRLPMSKDDVRQVARDIASALSFLHKTCRAVHTDLKPDNILAELQPSSNGRNWCICDFGSSSFYHGSSLDNDLITTRPYRAPEVVLKRGWTYHADTWSLGCILYELFTGRKLFDAQSDGEHLEVMQSRLGPIPTSMNPPRTGGALASKRFPLLRDELKAEPELLNLLEKLLRFDPNERIHCGDVLSHPFVSGRSSPTNAHVPTMPTASSAPAPAPLSAISASATNVQTSAKGSTGIPYPTSARGYTSNSAYGALPHPSAFPKASPSLVSPAITSGYYHR
jgi:serine/threonine protein kinase